MFSLNTVHLHSLYVFYRDSINAAQKVDEYDRPEDSVYRHLAELETVTGPMYGAVLADHKMGPKLHASSFRTAKSYNDDYKARRDELFAQIAKEKEASS